MNPTYGDVRILSELGTILQEEKSSSPVYAGDAAKTIRYFYFVDRSNVSIFLQDASHIVKLPSTSAFSLPREYTLWTVKNVYLYIRAAYKI